MASLVNPAHNLVSHDRAGLTRTKIISHFLVVGLSVFPLYVFASGRPQLAHIVLGGFIVLCFAWVRHSAPSTRPAYVLCFLCGVIAVRQAIEGFTQGTNGLMPVAYIVYNTLLGLAVCNFIVQYQAGALSVIRKGVLASILIAVLGVGILGFSFIAVEGVAVRTVGTFNNPNQLGYYSLCLMGIAGVAFLREQMSKLTVGLVFAACAFLVALSLSKAAMVGFVFYLLIFFARARLNRTAPVVIVIVLAAGFLGFYFRDDVEQLKLFSRLGTLGLSSDDSLEARGYSVLFNPDARLLYGWGEGYLMSARGHEVHSTIGNILISYGLLGCGVFAYLLLVVFRRTLRQFGLIAAIGFLAPVLLYGLTHNGFRFSIFWVYLGVLLSLGYVSETRNGFARRMYAGRPSPLTRSG